MNTHKSLSVPCDQVGKLVLVGILDQAATFMAVKIRIFKPDILKKHLETEFKAGIVTVPVNNTGYTTSAVFQCDLRGPLRNPRGFLKSVRNRLHKVLKRTELEFMGGIAVQEKQSGICFVCPDCGQSFDECECDDDGRGIPADAATDFIGHSGSPGGCGFDWTRRSIQ